MREGQAGGNPRGLVLPQDPQEEVEKDFLDSLVPEIGAGKEKGGARGRRG